MVAVIKLTWYDEDAVIAATKEACFIGGKKH